MAEKVEVPYEDYKQLVESSVILDILCRFLSVEKYVTLNDVRNIIGLGVKEDGTAGEPDAD